MARSSRTRRDSARRRRNRQMTTRRGGIQRGGFVPFVVDFKKGAQVTRDAIEAMQKPIDRDKARRDVSRYKTEYQSYKRRGGNKGYTSWARDKGYAKKSDACCLQ